MSGFLSNLGPLVLAPLAVLQLESVFTSVVTNGNITLVLMKISNLTPNLFLK